MKYRDQREFEDNFSNRNFNDGYFYSLDSVSKKIERGQSLYSNYIRVIVRSDEDDVVRTTNRSSYFRHGAQWADICLEITNK